METINAKKELSDLISHYNLEILSIQCKRIVSEPISSSDNEPFGNLFRRSSSYHEENINSLEGFDFDYDNDYGTQILYGTVYCRNKTNGFPVWLTRGEYDGSEWWNVNVIPEFYHKNLKIID